VTIDALIPLLVILPIGGFALTALIGRRLGKGAHWIPVLVIFGAWVIAMALAYQVLSGAAPLLAGSEEVHGYALHWFTWIPADQFVVDVGFLVDPLTACLLIVVTTIGLLVHIYSVGYMAHDPGYWRFFAYLNLFMFSMLLLVLADSWSSRGSWSACRATCSSASGIASGPPRSPPRRHSSSTASATLGSRSGSWRSGSIPRRSTASTP
jgi:formate hydrogenlyase subunit 3/multisubunit Na+/H+ antiporter MnhD subunit